MNIIQIDDTDKFKLYFKVKSDLLKSINLRKK